MRVALVPMSVEDGFQANVDRISAHVARAASTDLVLFPEAALSRFPSGRDAARDAGLAVPIPSPVTQQIADLALRHGRWIGLGLVEHSASGLFDSALLVGPDGTRALHYRRNHPGWFYPDADRHVYRVGREIPVVTTPGGRTAFLVCGDLFDDRVVERTAALRLDLLLVPMARSLVGGTADWAEEIPTYQARVARIGVPTLIVNRSDGAFVGGAMALDAAGEVRAAMDPTSRRASLLVDTQRLADDAPEP